MVYLQQPLCFFNGGTKIEWSNWAMKRGLSTCEFYVIKKGLAFWKCATEKRIGGKFEIKTVV